MDEVFEGIRELCLGLHTIDVADKGAIIDGRSVGVESVCSNILIGSSGVDGQIGGFEPFPEDIAHRNMSQLSGLMMLTECQRKWGWRPS